MEKLLRIVPWVLFVLAAFFAFIKHEEVKRLERDISQLHGTNSNLVSEANKKLEQANQNYNELAADASQKQAELIEDVNKKLKAAHEPEVNIDVRFRKALLGSGGVAALSSRATQTDVFSIQITRTTTGQEAHDRITLDPGQTHEIGHMQGWAFISGDVIKISQPGHKSLQFRMD